MLYSLLILLVSALCTSSLFAQSPYLEPSELIKMMEASDVTYEIREDPEASTKSLLAFFPEQAVAYVRQPKFIERNGRAVLSSYQINPTADSLQREGEKFYQQKDYETASIWYNRSLLADPSDYTNLLYIGDCKLDMGDIEGALTNYQQAATKNPLDYQTHMFSSTAYTKLGKMTEARSAMVRALALFPHYAGTMAIARARAEAWGIEVNDNNYAPQAYVKESNGAYQIGIAQENKHWMIYGVAKALWEGEPQLRKKLINSEAKGWKMESERQALIALMIGYDLSKKSEGFVADRQIERIQAIHKAGLMDAYILYEIASHLNQNVVLQISPEGRALVEQYVDQFVIPVK
jgi:tetratricopeptide (TPR) repeat protein